MNNRYDFIYVFDVKDGNPNGDPDAGNLPRIDPETSQGLVSDVCIKRKIRNYVALKYKYQNRYNIYVREKAVLNEIHTEAYIKTGNERFIDKKEGKSIKGKEGEKAAEQAQAWLCENYFDIRTFGAVMSTKIKCGQVRGPVQLTISRSVDAIDYQDLSITRCAVTTQDEAEQHDSTMGRKSFVPYGLYVGHGFISPFFAYKTGFSNEDLSLLWEAFKCMFDQDHSAARGEMILRKLYIFKHDSELGNAPAYQLFDRLRITKKKEYSGFPRSYDDYEILLNTDDLPNGVVLDEASLL